MTTAPHPSQPTASVVPVKRCEIFGWCCFDFANSAFTTIIITVVYAVYFNNVVAESASAAAAWWGRTLAISQLLVIVISPWLGAVADFTARKKFFLLCSAVICSAATAALFFAGPGDVRLALALVLVANLAFAISENLCGSFLPEISTPQNVGRISGFGWAFGYFGGLGSLILALAIMRSGDGRVPWTFVMTAVFFLAACAPTWRFLRERARPQMLPAGQSYFAVGWGALGRTLRELPSHRTLAWFFVVFTLYMAGLTAVIAFASLYGNNVLHLTMEENVQLFMLLQITSALGAFACGFLQDRVGAKPALLLALVVWIGVSVWVTLCRSKGEFLVIGCVAGLGLGSLQASSRAVVSRLTPVERSGEFFGFWGLFGRVGAAMGPALMGQMASTVGYRGAALVNGLFFVAGLIGLCFLRLPRVAAEPVVRRG